MRLICGDALAVLPTLGDLSGHALVTDPPYGLGEDRWRGGKRQWSLADDGDGTQWDRAVPWIVEWVGRFAHAIVWGGHYYAMPPRRGWLIWDKMQTKFSSGQCELAWTTLDQPIRRFHYSHGELANEGKTHPTQKPLPLMRWCLGFLPAGIPVIDPFMGVGTTGLASHLAGRDFVGIESDPVYFREASRRIDEAQRCLDGRGVGPLFCRE